MTARPDEVTVLRRLVAAQAALLLDYGSRTRLTGDAVAEIKRCRQWLAEIDGERERTVIRCDAAWCPGRSTVGPQWCDGDGPGYLHEACWEVATHEQKVAWKGRRA